ncbi:MAG TPA: translation initiation factor IF-2 [Thermogutta sp.]|nr:translation initiation factor IF-2 [Thermogutta sp.]
MTQRIYSLAKELKLESKELMDICRELNLGKASALASLSDEEVHLIKEHIKRARGAGARPATASTVSEPAPVFRREDYIPPAGTKPGKVPVLDRKIERPSPRPEVPPSERPTPVTPTEPSPAVTATVEVSAPPTAGEVPLEPSGQVPVAPEVPPPLASETLETVVPTTGAPSAEVVEPPVAVEEKGPPRAVEVETPSVGPAVEVAELTAPEAVAAETPVVAPAEVSVEGIARAEEVSPAQATAATAVSEPSTAVPEVPLVTEVSDREITPQTTQEVTSEVTAVAPSSERKEEPPPPGLPPTEAERLAAIRPIPVLPRSRREAASQPGQPAEKKKKTKAEPPLPRLVKLAPLPTPKPAPVPKPKEPAPQKPEIKLPVDAIRASKMGAMPLAEHLLRQQEEKRKGKKKEKEETKGDISVPVLPRQKGRRTKEEELEAGEGPIGKVKRKKEAVRVEDEEEAHEELEATSVQPTRLRRTRSVSTAAPRKSSVVLELPCTVRTFAEALGLPAQKVLAKLFEMGTLANINATLTQEMAELLAVELGVDVVFKAETDPEEELNAIWNAPDPEDSLRPRPPVVTFLGHVDHGKTSLLDKILGINVAAKEKGGITQHIRAYQIVKNGRPITFLDTPGHEAFTAMRARGANCTDIVVLVVAADDGVMPQTEEAINHARAANVPIVVAINKIDLPGTRAERVMQQLTGLGLVPTEWGGDIEVIRTSALTGEGIPELLDTLITLGDLYELKANYDRPACGTCLEASLQPGRGVVAKLLVQKGTLRPGDIVVCDVAHGRVKAMYDPLQPHKRIQEATPATPVDLIGLDAVPEAGSRFVVLDDIAKARKIAEHRMETVHRREIMEARRHVTLANLLQQLSEKEKKTLHIILRADTRGSIEAIQKEIAKLEHPEVKIQVLQALVGGITVADVHLADASDAVIIGFNVVPDEDARELAERLKVQIRRYDIIYQVADDLKAALEGLLQPEKREVELGRALIQKVFHISRIGNVAGCRVLSGTITRDARLRVIRQNRIVGDYPIESLKREKDDVREVREGFECGIKLAGFDDIKEGDILEAYRIEEVKRTLETASQSTT